MITLLQRLYWKIYFLYKTELQDYDEYLDDLLMTFLELSPISKEVMKICTDEIVVSASVHHSGKTDTAGEKAIAMIDVNGGTYYNQFKESVFENYRRMKKGSTAMELCKRKIPRYKSELSCSFEQVSRNLEHMYGTYQVRIHRVENQIHNHPDISNTKRVLEDTLKVFVNQYLNDFFRTSNQLQTHSIKPQYRYDVRLKAVMDSFDEQVELTKESRENAQQQAVQEDAFSKEQKEFDALRANLDDLMKQ